MMEPSFNKATSSTGKAAAYLLFVMGFFYIIVTLLGLLNLPSPDQPISDPYFSLMEILIILMAPLLVLLMAVLYAFAPGPKKLAALAALLFMTVTSAITSCVHYVRLYASTEAVAEHPWFFSFTWPSVIYALDILAWDFFFGLSLLAGSFVFLERNMLIRTIRWLMLTSGTLSLIGLLGPITANIQIRNIGIIGYGILFPVLNLFLARFFASQEKQL